jgi:hypothetical protein
MTPRQKAHILKMIGDTQSLERELEDNPDHKSYQAIRLRIQVARLNLEAAIAGGELETKQ